MAFYHAALLRYLVPMPLELKDLATQKPLIVPEEGLTFGREGGDANIQLRDTGVSKRHARVFGENGAWFLEDLGSSNGTWLQKERIKDATELLPGDIFQMSQAKFEVVQVMADGEGAEPTNMARGDEGDDGAMDEEPPAEDEATPKPMPAAKEAPSKKNAGAAAAAAKEPSVSKGKNLSQPPPSKKMPAQAKPEPEPSKGAAKKPVDPGAAVPTDPGAGEPPKKTSIMTFISGTGLLILPTIIGVSLSFVQKAMHSTGSGSSSSVEAQVEAAQEQAEAAQKQADAQIAAAEKQAEAAQAQAEKQVAAAEKQVAAAEKQAEKAAAPTPPPAEPAKPAPPPPAPGKPAEAKHAEAAAPAPTGAGYAAWHSKLEAIEKRITDDPTILNKDASVLALYKKLEEEAVEAEAKFAKSKDPKRVRDHLRDAELYEKSEKTVGELYGKLFK